MDITGVDFITVPTRDFDRASAFYAEVLGLECSTRWGQMPAAEFETGTLTIAVMQSDAFGSEFQRHSHPIALHVADVAAAREELEGKGVSFAADTIGQRRVPHGALRRPGRQRAHAALAVRAEDVTARPRSQPRRRRRPTCDSRVTVAIV